MENPDAPLPEGIQIIQQEDFDRLENVETVEELKDVYDHFLLYHARSLGQCASQARFSTGLVLGGPWLSGVGGPDPE